MCSHLIESSAFNSTYQAHFGRLHENHFELRGLSNKFKAPTAPIENIAPGKVVRLGLKIG